MRKCGILREYSQFIDTVRKYSKEESSIKKAIRECIDQGILAEYLKRKGSEVENMLIAEYSYEEDIQVKQQEARQQGIQQGVNAVRKNISGGKEKPRIYKQTDCRGSWLYGRRSGKHKENVRYIVPDHMRKAVGAKSMAFFLYCYKG